MRQAAKLLWVVLGVVSLLAGFYDLYRNIPGAKHALAALYRLSGVPEARFERKRFVLRAALHLRVRSR
jgi:hypothetical protein